MQNDRDKLQVVGEQSSAVLSQYQSGLSQAEAARKRDKRPQRNGSTAVKDLLHREIGLKAATMDA